MQGSFLSLAGLASGAKNSWSLSHPSWQPSQDLLMVRKREERSWGSVALSRAPSGVHLLRPWPAALHRAAIIFKVRLKATAPHPPRIRNTEPGASGDPGEEVSISSLLPLASPTARTVWRTRPWLLRRTQADPEAPGDPASLEEWRKSEGKYSLLTKRAPFQDTTPSFRGRSKWYSLWPAGNSWASLF